MGVVSTHGWKGHVSKLRSSITVILGEPFGEEIFEMSNIFTSSTKSSEYPNALKIYIFREFLVGNNVVPVSGKCFIPVRSQGRTA